MDAKKIESIGKAIKYVLTGLALLFGAIKSPEIAQHISAAANSYAQSKSESKCITKCGDCYQAVQNAISKNIKNNPEVVFEMLKGMPSYQSYRDFSTFESKVKAEASESQRINIIKENFPEVWERNANPSFKKGN